MEKNIFFGVFIRFHVEMYDENEKIEKIFFADIFFHSTLYTFENLSEEKKHDTSKKL